MAIAFASGHDLLPAYITITIFIQRFEVGSLAVLAQLFEFGKLGFAELAIMVGIRLGKQTRLLALLGLSIGCSRFLSAGD